MFIKLQPSRPHRAFTIVEMMMSSAIGLLVIGSVISAFVFCGNNMLWLSTSASLNQSSQNALNKLTRELRGMSRVVNYARTSVEGAAAASSPITAITFAPKNSTDTNDLLELEYIPSGKRLLRRRAGQTEIILGECNSLQFNLFQRTQTNGTFSSIPTTNAAFAKLVQVQWVCSRSGGPSREMSQIGQSAQIVMRAK